MPIQATGNVGCPIVDALVAAGFSVTVGTRRASPNHSASDSSFPSSVSIQTLELDDVSSLAAVFSGQDAVAEAFSPYQARFKVNVVKAAIQSKVKHIITPEFSSDIFHKNAMELLIFQPKIEAQTLLEDGLRWSGIRWTAIITGPFLTGVCWPLPGLLFDERRSALTAVA